MALDRLLLHSVGVLLRRDLTDGRPKGAVPVDSKDTPSLYVSAQEHRFPAGLILTSGWETLARYQRLQIQAEDLDPLHKRAFRLDRRVVRARRILITLVVLAAALIIWPYLPAAQWWAALETTD